MGNTYRLFKNSVTIHANGRTATISKDDSRYEKVMGIIGKNSLEEMNGIVNGEALLDLENILGIEIKQGE